MQKIRSPICTVMGHVDHGKSSILDKIRGTSIVAGEAGKITQAIGASIIPVDVIKKVCGDLLKATKKDFNVPGLLFIDTPGHAAFTNLRKRGGNLADIAILVVDINEGFKPQTIEAIEILKNYKTPFIVAANKIDLIHGWSSQKGMLIQGIGKQDASTQEYFEKKMYELVGKLHEQGLASERFDRVEDYTKQIAIVPTSAQTGEGIPELLMVLTGLAEKFLEKCLECNIFGPARGTVLEVKESKGMGACLDVIIFDGKLKVNDTIVIGSPDKPISTKVRALLEPATIADMRDKKSKFVNIKEVFAATGVRISAPDIDNVVAGMPMKSCAPENVGKVKAELQKEVEEVMVSTDKEGIVIKADTLGSLEALSKLLHEKDIPIRSASVGNVSKKDVADAESNFEKESLQAVILGFNISVPNDVTVPPSVKIITHEVIYKIIEDFEKWHAEEKKRLEARDLDVLVRPCKMEMMKGYVFRQNNPAVCGMDILGGVVKTGTPLMKKGKTITTVKAIQSEGKNLSKVDKGKQVAISMDGVTVGRQVKEGDIFYSAIPEEDFKKIKTLKKHLSKEEIQIIKEIAEIMREDNPVWGI